jgi:hypothetical protein
MKLIIIVALLVTGCNSMCMQNCKDMCGLQGVKRLSDTNGCECDELCLKAAVKP